MRQYLSSIVAVLLLSITANTAMASQMLVESISTQLEMTQTEKSDHSQPCHGSEKDSATDQDLMDCCANDCTNCILTISLFPVMPSAAEKYSQASNFDRLIVSKVENDSTNLYRPPILS